MPEDREKPGPHEHGSSAPHAAAAATAQGADLHKRQEALVDEAVEETFPASDPTSVFRLR